MPFRNAPVWDVITLEGGIGHSADQYLVVTISISFEVSKLSRFVGFDLETLGHKGLEVTMSRSQFWVTAMGFLLFLAAAGSAAAQNLNGKELYRNNCKVCHDKGSVNGQYTPMTLTQDQWRSFFKTKLTPMHKNALHPNGAGRLLELLTPEQLKAIQRFAIDHAADSEQPATCG